MIWQDASATNLKEAKYEKSRDHILNLVNQKVQMIKPVPMDVGNVDKGKEGEEGGKRRNKMMRGRGT